VLVRLQKMSDADRREMEEAVAWRWMGTGATPEQAAWRDAVTQRSQSTSLIERRVRMTLGEGDKAGLRFWLAKLPAEALQKEEWRYWQAMLLLDNGQRQDGEAILRSLMQGRGFYPMVAAQKLGIPYALTITSSIPDKTLAQRPEIARVRELMYWNMDNLARSEWGELAANSDKP
ncbi:murein transglycosylase, partial [Candidatus Symbiopectobacterium sp. NZEC127]|nr:murein transglycosylase [Candidatus Symbiopectobacterium sp. NZEC127]